jgi:hypothetical protein
MLIPSPMAQIDLSSLEERGTDGLGAEPDPITAVFPMAVAPIG